MDNTTLDIMGRLRAATDDLHKMAEGRPLQRKLVQGSLPRETYAAFLGQMYAVHHDLEHRIRDVADRHRAFATVVHDYHWREEQLRDDLAFLDWDADEVASIQATDRLRRVIEQTAEEQPVALLGMLYVLEGSTNGSKFIARALTKAWDLPPGPGLSYLDPHGDLQPQRWGAFKSDMNAVGFSEDEATTIIEAARVVFQAIADISDELNEPVTV